MFLRGVLVGWVSMLIGIAAVGILAKAFSCERQYGGVNTISKHINPGRKYNEKNYGLFYECRRNQDWSYQLGYYENSFNRETLYGIVMYQPWRLFGMRLGGFAGAGTGYREKEVDGEDIPTGGLSPLAGGMVSIEGRGIGLNIIAATSVIALQLKVEF